MCAGAYGTSIRCKFVLPPVEKGTPRYLITTIQQVRTLITSIVMLQAQEGPSLEFSVQFKNPFRSLLSDRIPMRVRAFKEHKKRSLQNFVTHPQRISIVTTSSVGRARARPLMDPLADLRRTVAGLGIEDICSRLLSDFFVSSSAMLPRLRPGVDSLKKKKIATQMPNAWRWIRSVENCFKPFFRTVGR